MDGIGIFDGGAFLEQSRDLSLSPFVFHELQQILRCLGIQSGPKKSQKKYQKILKRLGLASCLGSSPHTNNKYQCQPNHQPSILLPVRHIPKETPCFPCFPPKGWVEKKTTYQPPRSWLICDKGCRSLGSKISTIFASLVDFIWCSKKLGTAKRQTMRGPSTASSRA